MRQAGRGRERAPRDRDRRRAREGVAERAGPLATKSFAFRIMTPPAIEWTALHKYCDADARTIVYREALNIRYNS